MSHISSSTQPLPYDMSHPTNMPRDREKTSRTRSFFPAPRQSRDDSFRADARQPEVAFSYSKWQMKPKCGPLLVMLWCPYKWPCTWVIIWGYSPYKCLWVEFQYYTSPLTGRGPLCIDHHFPRHPTTCWEGMWTLNVYLKHQTSRGMWLEWLDV